MRTQIPIQYYELKKKHPDAVLLFRIGDFYETFGDDAITISDILNLALTRRLNGDNTSIELAGFPHHALDKYLPRLVRAGKRVAICEQLEDPKITKKLVKSQITELVTPNNQYHIKACISCVFAILTAFCDIINKLSIFEEIRAKTKEIHILANTLGISPKKAFEECGIPSQLTLFEF